MTSNTDKNLLIGQADESLAPLNSYSSRSADLEKIINDLGRTVAENQSASSEPVHANMAGAEGSDAISADLSLAAAGGEPDIFGALGSQAPDVMQELVNVGGDDAIDLTEVASSDIGVEPQGKTGDLENLADWNQSMADELSRIYTEIDGDEEVVLESVSDFADLAMGDEVIAGVGLGDEIGDEVVAVEPIAVEPIAVEPIAVEPIAVEPIAVEPIAVEPIAVEPIAVEPIAVEPIAVEPIADEPSIDELELDAEPAFSLSDEEMLDSTYMAVAMQATSDLPLEGVMGQDPLSEIIADAGAGIADGHGDENVDVPSQVLTESRLEEIASRIEEMLGDQNDDTALKSIEVRFDHLEEKLNAIIEYPETDAGLFALEAQMNDLKDQFHKVEAQLSGIAVLEGTVNSLIVEVKSSNGVLNTVAAGVAVAGAAVGELSIDDDAKNDRLAELGGILENYIMERRDTDRYAAGAFSDIQTGLDDIANYLTSHDPALGGQAEVVAPVDVHSEQQPVSAHGAAQETYGLELNAEEFASAHVADDDVTEDDVAEDLGSEEPLNEISAGLETDGLAEHDAQAYVDTSDVESASQEVPLSHEEPVVVADVVPAPPAAASVPVERAQIAPEIAEEARVDVEQRQQILAAEHAAEAAKIEAVKIQARANEASRSGDFLASARKAAIVAAAHAEIKRVDEKEKKGKKKSSLFSFKFGGVSPVLVVATTILSATTAGLVYSVIEDQPVQHDVARSSSVPGKVIAPQASKKSRQSALVAVENVASEERFIINDVPHRRGAGTEGVDVPVGIVIKDPTTKPGLKQLAAVKRRQQLAKMSSDLTGGTPPLHVTNIAFAPETSLKADTPSVARNTGPTLTLPPAAIGPFSLRVAAAKGDAGSQFDVATRYAQGRGVKRDFTLAAKWYGRAAAQGHAIAQYRLAALYEKGKGVGRDASRAQTWYRRSAEKGNVKAMHNLAVLHTGRSGKAADYTTAAQWFKSAAEHGLPDSQYNLAILYANGLGVKRSKTEAYKWFGLAAARGDRAAAKRQTALMSAMSGSQVKVGKKLVAIWQEKATAASANLPHKAASALKKSNISIDQNKVRLVRQAQSMLGRLGYSVGVADGRMGPKTRDAIRNFQKRSGMKVTGDVSSALISRLNGLAG